MGVHYVRCNLKSSASHAAADSLIEKQAVAFQSICGWNQHAVSTDKSHAILEQLHREAYLEASRELAELIDYPRWDEDRNCPHDHPKLPLFHRVYPITMNPIFPPLHRVRAHRTMLPEKLASQLSQWKTWTTEVAGGHHDDYVKELHLFATTDFLHYHWSLLRGLATVSLEKTTNWATRPDFQAVRDEILLLEKPTVYDVPIVPDTSQGPPHEESYLWALESTTRILELSKQWNRRVRGNWKIHNYTSSYSLTLDEFKKAASNERITEFYSWADQCLAHGFGFYLDY